MRLPRKVQAVERIFNELETETRFLQNRTGLECITGCGRCCENPNIEAAVLEFLPWAYYTFIEGKAESIMDELQDASQRPICHLYKHLYIDGSSGLCKNYAYRGLICRLFGFSTKRDKWGKQQLITCKRIKEETNVVFEGVEKYLNEGGKAPIASQYYDKLRNIDNQLANEILPVNEALLRALKEVLSYYTYRAPSVRRSA